MAIHVNKNGGRNIGLTKETAVENVQEKARIQLTEASVYTKTDDFDTYGHEKDIHTRIIQEIIDEDIAEDDSLEAKLLFGDEDFAFLDEDTGLDDNNKFNYYVYLITEQSNYIEYLIENPPSSDEMTTLLSDVVDFSQLYENKFFNALFDLIVLLEKYEDKLMTERLTPDTDEFIKNFQELLHMLYDKEPNLNKEQKEQLKLFRYVLRDYIIILPKISINSGNPLKSDLNVVNVIQTHSRVITHFFQNNLLMKSIGQEYSDDIFIAIEDALISSNNIEELKNIKKFLTQEKQYLNNPIDSSGCLVNLFKSIDYQKTDKLIASYLDNIEDKVNNRLQHLEHIQKQEQESINNIIEGINTTCQQIYNENQNISKLVNKHKKIERSIANIRVGIEAESRRSSKEKKIFLETLKNFVSYIFNKLVITRTNYDINEAKFKLNMLSSQLNEQHQLYYKTTGSHYDYSFTLLNPSADNNTHNLMNEQIANKKFIFFGSISSFYNILDNTIYEHKDSIVNYEDTQQIKQVLDGYMQSIIANNIPLDSTLLLHTTQQVLAEITQNVIDKKYSNMEDIASDIEDTLAAKLQESNDVLSVSIDSKFVLESRGIISRYQLARHKSIINKLEEVDRTEGYNDKILIDDIKEIINLCAQED